MSSSPATELSAGTTNLDKIEHYLATSIYLRSIEVSASYNRRLSNERRQRLPFLDPQTGIAQRHCALYVKQKQRMPGTRHGQIYTYPASRFRKSKSVAHLQHQQPCTVSSAGGIGLAVQSILQSGGSGGAFMNGCGSTSGGFLLSQHEDNSNSCTSLLLDKSSSQVDSVLEGDTNSRDTNNNSKDWLYDDLDNEFDTISEPKSPDDEYDYDPRYGNKKRKIKASKKETKAKKSAFQSSNFDGFIESRSRRNKDGISGSSTPKKGEGGAERGRAGRRKGSTNKKKRVVEPISFDSAASMIMDSNSFDAHEYNRSYRPYL